MHVWDDPILTDKGNELELNIVLAVNQEKHLTPREQ